MKKIGFLYIDKSYAIYHSLNIAIKLAQLPVYEVHILCTKSNQNLIVEILNRFNVKNINVKTLRPFWYFTLPHYLEIKAQLRKTLFYKYAKLLGTFDAFICTIYDDLFLKKVIKNKRDIKYIFTNHGISNRAYSFDDKIVHFDLFFLLDKKEEQIRRDLNQLNKLNHATTGFLKFDLVSLFKKKLFFDNDNPTILYNPHWDKRFTSFFEFGENILVFFAKNKNYNLIFAPHALLLERNWLLWFKMLKYRKCENIIIDLGSELSNDMSYTKYADLYLGDISSQVFEFLYYKERPCLYLDAHNLNNSESDHPLSWDLGEVISNVNNLEENIVTALVNHNNEFKKKQSDKMKEMFHSGDISPTQIATEAIDKLLFEK